MKRLTYGSYSCLLFLLLLSISCTTSSKLAQSTTTNNGDILANENKNGFESYISLGDYLKRYPGVSFTGSSIVIRNMVSTSSNEALFVVDHVVIGNSYTQAASIVDVNNIKHVSILKSGADAAMYGAQGSNGVVVITTKKK